MKLNFLIFFESLFIDEGCVYIYTQAGVKMAGVNIFSNGIMKAWNFTSV